MDIAQMSISMNQAKLHQEVGASVMKLAMDSMEVQGEDLSKMLEDTTQLMEQSIDPYVGGNIDIKL